MRLKSAASSVTITIANQLQTQVEVYDVFNDGTDDQPKLKYTLLGTVGVGATSTVDTIREVSLLVATITGTIAEMHGHYYCFPVKGMSGTKLSYKTDPPGPYTITEADRIAAVHSFNFNKFAMANPDSVLAKNFRNALKGGYKAVNKFFQGTKNFTDCTMASWHLVVTWLDNYASGWQGPYYFYEEPPASPPANFKANLVATLDIASDPSPTILKSCSAGADGVPVYGSQQTTLVMGAGTLSDADPGNDAPVSLTPVWMNVIQKPSGDPTAAPTYLVGKGMAGTIGGMKVVAFQTIQSPGGSGDGTKDGGKEGWDKFQKGATVLFVLVGLIQVFDVVKRLFSKKNRASENNRRDAANDRDLAARNDATRQQVDTEIRTAVTERAETVDAGAQTVASDEAGIARSTRAQTLKSSINEKVQAVEDQIADMVEQESYVPDRELEDKFKDVQDSANDAMAKIDDGDFESWQGDFKAKLTALKETAANEDQRIQDRVDELDKSYDDAVKEADAVKTAEDQQRDQSKEAENEGDPDYNDDPAEGEPVPVGE